MARPQTNPDEAFGSDSFLDIVANMVGILIILVIIAGLRAKGIPQKMLDAAAEIAGEVRMLTAQGSAIEHENMRLNHETEAVQAAQVALTAESEQFVVLRDQLKADLDARRLELDSTSQLEFDLKRKLAAAQLRLARVDAELAEVEQVQPATVTKIESYPTPLSQTVSGKELHFQVRDNRIVYVPLDELVDLFKSEAPQRASQLRGKSEAVDTIGPIGGFRMRYVLERVDKALAVGSGGVVTGSYARLEQFALLQVQDDLGEPVEQALLPGSRFLSRLASLQPERTTITLWTYPESFTSYRKVRKLLYHDGFLVAARPLPDGQPIGGSPQGTKSAAQ